MAMANAHAPIPDSRSGVARSGTLLIALPTELVHVVNRKEFMVCLKAKALIHAIKCVQSMPNGVFRVTCKTKDAYTWLCSNGIAIRGFQCSIMEAEPSYTLVRLFRCPFEVSDEALVLGLSPFGKVINIKHETDRDFPSVVTGTRLVRMRLASDIPSRIKVKRYPCNVWYQGQPKTCRICGEDDHEAPTCPYKGKCLRCLQEGHTARNCENAWGIRANAPENPPADVPGAPENPPDDVPVAPENPPDDVSVTPENPPDHVPVSANEPELPDPSSEPAPGSLPESCSPSSEESTSPTSSGPSAVEETPMETSASSAIEPESHASSDTFDPSASLFSDSSPAATDPSQGVSSQPLVDKDGFVTVLPRSSRRRATRQQKVKPSTLPRSRSPSCSRSRSRSPLAAPSSTSSPVASVSLLKS